MDVTIIPILDDNYAYLIQSGDVVGVIDPGESRPVINVLEEKGLSLDWVINTHKHWDHVNGNQKLLNTYNAKLAAPQECGQADITLKNAESFPFGDVTFDIIATPGHTAGHIVLFDPTYQIMFAGDTIFPMGCGRVFEGTMEDMYQSMQVIKSLPPETAIYCGHDYITSNVAFAKHILPNNLMIFEREKTLDQTDVMPTTLAEELRTNPFLLAESLEQFSTYRQEKDQF